MDNEAGHQEWASSTKECKMMLLRVKKQGKKSTEKSARRTARRRRVVPNANEKKILEMMKAMGGRNLFAIFAGLKL